MMSLLLRTLGAKRTKCGTVALSAGIMAVVIATSVATAADWPGFRGGFGDGASRETGVFAGRDSFGLDVAWKKPSGSGYAGIAVADGRVVTLFSDGTSDVAAAFDVDTGNEQWRFKIDATYEGHDGSHTGPIATPLIANGRVFGIAPRGRMFALDLKSGEMVWDTNLVDDHGVKKPHYGFGTSPMLVDGVLVVQIGAEEAAVAGFDPATGKQLWTAGGDGVSYQSPVRATLTNGGAQILIAGNKNLLGINPADGGIIWEHPHGGEGARGLMSMVPVPAGDDRIFLAYKDDRSTLVTLSGTGDAFSVATAWEDRSIRNSYNVPVYHDGHVYAYSSRFLTCVDANTGESVWRSRQPGDG
ncbi:MAG: PQQ-binding-like beta-propeller repeat protein, partial [Phycisphaerae bacterium]